KVRHPKYFTQADESPRLVEAVKALYPRWSTFILTGLLAGLRWGESAALMRSDLDFTRGRIHVQRTISGRGAVAPPKNGRERWVQQQLGHASISQTADTYGHVQPERHEAAVEGLDRYVS